MPDTKISELPAASTLAGTEALPVVQSSSTKKATVAQVLAGAQPLDSDLTAIAALATTAFGRSFLALADAAAGRTLLALGTASTAAMGDFQPLDSDLTAIAALSTTAYGRSLLEAANAAALRSLAGLGNVDNTSDANKPISTATQTALDAKVSSADVDDIVVLTQAAYDLLDPPDGETLYVVVG